MKKFLMITMLLFSMFTLAASYEVKAVDPSSYDDEWTVSIVSTDDCSPSPDCNSAMQATLDLPAGIEEITIIVPSSYYHAINATGVSSVNAYILLADSAGSTLKTITWEDQFGSQLSGSFRIDFAAFDAADTASITILIPQTFRYNAIPAAYLAYLQDNMDYTYEYSTSTDIYMIGDLVTSYHRFYTTVDLPIGTKSLTVYTHNMDYLLIYNTIYKSRLTYYDEDDIFLYTEYLSENVVDDADVIDIAIDFDDVDLNEIAYFEIVLYYDPDLVTNETIDAANVNLDFQFNERELITVNYLVDGVVDETRTQLLGFIYPQLDPTVEFDGYDFAYWILPDGQIVYSYTGIAEDHVLEGNYVNLYAVFYFDGGAGGTAGDNPEPDDTRGINKLLNAVGFNTPLGYMLVFLLTLIVITYVLVSKLKAPVFVTIIADALLMILFTYWGLLPTYVTVSASIFFAVGALMTITTPKGGAESE